MLLITRGEKLETLGNTHLWIEYITPVVVGRNPILVETAAFFMRFVVVGRGEAVLEFVTLFRIKALRLKEKRITRGARVLHSMASIPNLAGPNLCVTMSPLEVSINSMTTSRNSAITLSST